LIPSTESIEIVRHSPGMEHVIATIRRPPPTYWTDLVQQFHDFKRPCLML
jgi:hypothetical protein